MIDEFIARWMPSQLSASGSERLRSACGALAGLLLAGLLSHYWLAGNGTAIFMVAPVGASAVLVFCLPASPLAQPWAVVGGNVVSGLVGAACMHWLGTGVPVAALACCLAIGAMFALRCLHPPGGAVALTTVIGGPAVHAAGFGFPLGPVLLNSALLVLAGMLYNNLTKRPYPHRQQVAQPHPHGTRDEVPTVRMGFTPDDLDAVLKQHNQVLDISRDDLQSLFMRTEQRAHQRRFGIITCADIMSRDIVSAEFGTSLEQAWRAILAHRVGAVPVLNRARRVIGIVTQTDFLSHGGVADYRGMRRQLARFLQPSGNSHGEKAEVVGQIMHANPVTARMDTPIVDLVPLMSDSGFHHIPIVDRELRFVGIVTQSDLVAALYQGRLAETGS